MKENELNDRTNEVRESVKAEGAENVILSLIEERDKILAEKELLNESMCRLDQEAQNRLRLIDSVFEEAKENGSVRRAIGRHTYHIQFVAKNVPYDVEQNCMYESIDCRISIKKETVNPT